MSTSPAYLEAARTARNAEDRRIRAETAMPRAIQRAFDNGIEVLERLGPTTFLMNSGTRDDRGYVVHVNRRRYGYEPNYHGRCTCEGAWLGSNLCQHLALAFLHLGRIDQYGNLLPKPKRAPVVLDEAALLARKEKYLDLFERRLARIRAAAEKAS
jgi:hypothetical protein